MNKGWSSAEVRRDQVQGSQCHRARLCPFEAVARTGHSLRQTRRRLPSRCRAQRCHRLVTAFIRHALVKDVGGRTETVEVEPWSDDDLALIAQKGFDELHVDDPAQLGGRMASESYGSPQIMQQLCLEICERVNGVESALSTRIDLQEPADWAAFWRLVQDEDSSDWLSKL